MPRIFKKLKKTLKIFGPGVITGAADDDPSGIATYSQAGAEFGYGQLWVALFVLPLMTAIQEACARIGSVTGKGLAAVIKQHYSKKILLGAVVLILIANTINIGADIGALAAALQLILNVNFVVIALGFTALILILEIFTCYRTYSRILKWLALALIAYPITVFLVKEPWFEIFKATFVPHIEFSFAFLFIIVGVIGTTISPYMFFWEASEEVEEEKACRLNRATGLKKFVKKMRWDNFIGMLFSNVVMWSIIVVAATVLHKNGVTSIGTAADAAAALEPLVHTFANAGFWAKFIFSVGIIGVGLLAVPVLSGSASYALSEALDWREGLNLKLKKAHGFYGVITIATIIGLAINFIGINPIKALIFTAVINGVVAVPLIFLIARIANNKEIMGEYKSGKLSNALVWLTFIVMLLAAAGMLIVV